MCVSPKYISVENTRTYNNVCMKRFSSDVQALLRPYRFSNMMVPCGKCVECMKDRSNDIGIRSYFAAQKFGSMHFVTLTYAPEYLPLAARLCMVDKSSGEVFTDYKYRFISDKHPKIKQLREFFSNVKSRKPRYFYDDDLCLSSLPYLDSDYYYYFQVTPSIDRRDVRLWLKSARIEYKRKKGFSLPLFKYICIGEFGPITCRPHYHIAFFGLDKSQVEFIVSRWKYGFTQIKCVKPVNKDGSNGFLAAAKYIGKYVSKGVFECESVKDGNAEKPRLLTSINLFELTENQIKFYRCQDVFGCYNIDSLRFSDSNCVFSYVDLQKLHEEALKRNFINLQGLNYKLPRSLIKKIWYVKDSVKNTFRASNIRIALSSFVQTDIVQSFVDECRKSGVQLDSEDMVKAINTIKNCDKYCKSSRAEGFFKAFQEFYNKSKF